jgi:GGDEF domain-containing protein
MNQRSQRPVEEYLRQSDVQARIWENIREARENLTVTISRAASLFGFSESKLREWEKRGLLQTERSSLSQEGKGSTGHRQYSSAELDKLAIIRELVSQGGYAPGEIPLNVDQIWNRVAGERAVPSRTGRAFEDTIPHTKSQRWIEKRVENTDQEESWRYFVSQALRLSLVLICESIPDTIAGLILPLEDRKLAHTISAPSDLAQVGPSLVGWMGRNRSFYSFLTEAPEFEYPTDFRVQTLRSPEGAFLEGDRVLDNIIVVLQRKTRPLSLTPELIETVQHILDLVYKRINTWHPAFDYGMHDWHYKAYDLERASREAGDLMFSALLERVIELGGKTSEEQNRWSFCALLLPNETNLPIQQQILIVRAQTQNSPYEIGVTAVNPARTDSLALKAFQSGQVVYFAETLPGETMTTYQLPSGGGISSSNPTFYLSGGRSAQAALEKSTRSAIAIPLVGEYGISIAVLYVAANEARAFSQADQRVLRIVARMLEELLLTSQSRRQATGRPGNLIANPSMVDITFEDFGSETDFLVEIEGLLETIQREKPTSMGAQESLSIIEVDIDNQSQVATRYGNRVARNLSQQAGLRIKGQMQFSSRYASGKLFHLSADRYCFVLRGLSLEETQSLARQLKSTLDGAYLIHPLSATPGRPASLENMQGISGVTTHLGMQHYPFKQLANILQRYPVNEAVKSVRAVIVSNIEAALERGKTGGGNCIMTWDPEIWNYRSLD